MGRPLHYLAASVLCSTGSSCIFFSVGYPFSWCPALGLEGGAECGVLHTALRGLTAVPGVLLGTLQASPICGTVSPHECASPGPPACSHAGTGPRGLLLIQRKLLLAAVCTCLSICKRWGKWSSVRKSLLGRALCLGEVACWPLKMGHSCPCLGCGPTVGRRGDLEDPSTCRNQFLGRIELYLCHGPSCTFPCLSS